MTFLTEDYETETAVIKILKKLIGDHDITEEQIRTIDFAQNNLLDSIMFVTLVVELETEFNIVVDDDDLEIPNLSQLNSIVAMVKRLQSSS